MIRRVTCRGKIQRSLRAHLARIKELHGQDRGGGGGKVYLPFALKRNYPNAERDWIWQYVFPAVKPSLDPLSGEMRRHFSETICKTR